MQIYCCFLSKTIIVVLRLMTTPYTITSSKVLHTIHEQLEASTMGPVPIHAQYNMIHCSQQDYSHNNYK